MYLTAIIFWLIYIVGVGAALLMPIAGILLYILIYHINPDGQWWGASIRAMGLRTSMTIAVATIIGILLQWPRLTERAKQFSMPIILAIMLLMLSAASLTWGHGDSGRGMYQIEKFAKILVFVFLMIRCVRDPHHYHFVVMVWLCGLAYIGYQAWGDAGSFISGRLTRGIGGPDFADSSGLAVHLVASLPFVGAMFFMARRWWSRGFVLLIGALTVNTIIMTRTRNAIVGFVAMGIMAVFALPRGYRRKGFAGICLGLLLAFQLADPHWWNRMRTIVDYKHDAAAMNRLTYWAAAIEMAADHPFGIGTGNYQEVVKEYVPGLKVRRSAHSSYFVCLAELGYLGLTLLLLLLAVTLWRLNSLRKSAAHFDSEAEISIARYKSHFHLGWHAMALQSAIVAYAAGGAFTTRIWTEGFWILIGMSCCLSNVAARLREDELPDLKPLGITGDPEPFADRFGGIQPAMSGEGS